MDKMGLELVSLNIQDVSDNNGYYENIASIDASDKQQAANIKSAEVERATREKRQLNLKKQKLLKQMLLVNLQLPKWKLNSKKQKKKRN